MMMNQCALRQNSWDINDQARSATVAAASLLSIDPNGLPNSAESGVTKYGSEVAELTWENGNLSMSGFRPFSTVGNPVVVYPPVAPRPPPTQPLPRHNGTLEAVVNQAAIPAVPISTYPSLPTWKLSCPRGGLVQPVSVVESAPVTLKRALAYGEGSSGHGGDTAAAAARKQGRLDTGADGSMTAGRVESTLAETTLDDTCELYGGGFTTTSSPENGGGSPVTENTSCFRGGFDSACHSFHSQRDGVDEDGDLEGDGDGDGEKKPVREKHKSSISTKRSRASSVHNLSERKRRDRINQKMKTLQKLVNSSKTDKASILDEVIEHLKQLQSQLHVIRGANSIPHMMMPMSMPQMYMALLANTAHQAHLAHISLGLQELSPITWAGGPFMSAFPFLPTAAAVGGGSWADPSGSEHHMMLQPPSTAIGQDPSSSFRAYQAAQAHSQAQPMSLEFFNKMAALYKQLYSRVPS